MCARLSANVPKVSMDVSKAVHEHVHGSGARVGGGHTHMRGQESRSEHRWLQICLWICSRLSTDVSKAVFGHVQGRGTRAEEYKSERALGLNCARVGGQEGRRTQKHEDGRAQEWEGVKARGSNLGQEGARA